MRIIIQQEMSEKPIEPYTNEIVADAFDIWINAIGIRGINGEETTDYLREIYPCENEDNIQELSKLFFAFSAGWIAAGGEGAEELTPEQKWDYTEATIL